MATADKIALVAAIAAVISAIIAWFARRDSNKSAIEAQRANELACMPVFGWRSKGRTTDNDVSYNYINHGELVFEPKVIVSENLEGTIEPNPVVASGDKGRVIFNWSKQQKCPNPIRFSIHFRNKLKELKKLDFVVSTEPSDPNDFLPKLA
jgi:hypothetical protein